MQDLACGLFELKPKPGDDGAGPSADGNEAEEELQTLQMPTQQTAAVAAAKRAGRTLVSEVGDDADDDDGEALASSAEKRQRRDEPTQGCSDSAAGASAELEPAPAVKPGGRSSHGSSGKRKTKKS